MNQHQNQYPAPQQPQQGYPDQGGYGQTAYGQPGYEQYGVPQQPGNPQDWYPQQPSNGLPAAYGTLKTLTVVSMVIVVVLCILALIVSAVAASGWSGFLIDAVGGEGTSAGIIAVVLIFTLVTLACYVAVIIGIGKRAAWGRLLGMISCGLGLAVIGILSLTMIFSAMSAGGGAFLGALIVVLIFFGPFLVVNAFWLKTSLAKELNGVFQ